jgi:hypothetical protein
MHRTLICLPILLALLAGCGLHARRVDVRLAEGNFPPRPATAEVELWVGETDLPKIPIAIISSSRTAERSAEAREAQVEELRQRARDLGAHAVENLRVETAEVNGIVADPRTPFTAFKQGEFDLHFVRGTAVYYLTDQEIAAREALGIPAP